MSRALVLVFILIVLAVGYSVGSAMLGDSTPLFGGVFSALADPGAPVDRDETQTQVFTVDSGESAADIGSALQQQGLVRSSLYFRLLVDQQGVGSDLTAGAYDLSPAMSTQQIVQTLASGAVRRGIVVTIPEGWRAAQIADRLQQAGFANGDEFLQAVANPPSVPDVGLLGSPPPATLEGYLFPQTYQVQQHTTGVNAAAMMLQMFDQTATNQLISEAAGSQLSPAQYLTLASIVEREAKLPSERALIAGVYMNRLNMGMPLQADPTVQYAVATRDGAAASAYGYWKPDLTEADLAIDSPYNTYQHTGLPPGPICNPGLPSIQAALQPAKTDYLYFVAKGDGSHLFAKTLAEQNANIAKIESGQ